MWIPIRKIHPIKIMIQIFPPFVNGFSEIVTICSYFSYLPRKQPFRHAQDPDAKKILYFSSKKTMQNEKDML